MGQDDLQLRLRDLEQGWTNTNNPLYAWEAVALSLAMDPPLQIPNWCLPCVAKAASNITDLAWQYGRTILGASKNDAAEVAKEEWDNIRRRLPDALGFATERKKNMFARRSDDAFASQASYDHDYGLQTGTMTSVSLNPDGSVHEVITEPVVPTEKRVGARLSVDLGAAKRIIARGRKFKRPG
jgi:hypothetical protein